jgi:hypothetical protein
VICRGAFAGLGAVLAVEPLRTVELAPGAREAGLALAPPVHRVAVGPVVTEALVSASRAEAAGGAGLGAVGAGQAAGAAAVASHVVAVALVLAPAGLLAARSVGAGAAGAGAAGPRVAGRAEAAPGDGGAGAVRGATGRALLPADEAEETPWAVDAAARAEPAPLALALPGLLVAGGPLPAPALLGAARAPAPRGAERLAAGPRPARPAPALPRPRVAPFRVCHDAVASVGAAQPVPIPWAGLGACRAHVPGRTAALSCRDGFVK